MDKKLFLCITALCLTITTATSDEDPKETENIECKQDGFLPHPTNCRAYYWCSLRRRVRAIILECEPNEIFDTQSQKCTYPNLSTRIECGGTKQLANTRSVRSPAQERSYECNKEEFIGDENECSKFYRCASQGGGQFALYEFSCAPGTVWDTDISSCNHKWAVKGPCGQGLVNSPPKGEYTPYPEQPYPIYPQQPSYPSQSQEGSNYNWQQSQNEYKPPKEQPSNPDQTYEGYDNPNPINQWPQNGPSNEYPSPPLPTSPKPEQTTPSDKNEGSSVPPVIDNEINSDSTECQSEGFIPDPKDCTKFYRCVENGKRRFMKYEFTCGQGTVWDSQINACNHVWAVRKDNCKYKVDQPKPIENGNETNGSEDKPNNKPIGEGGSIIDNSTLPTEEHGSSTPPNEQNTSTTIGQTTSTEKLPYEEKEPTTIGQTTSTEKLPYEEKEPTTIGQTNSTSPNQEIYECTKDGFIPDKTDCKKFYRCVQQNKKGFIKYEFSCGQGTVWDSDANTCNFPWATRNKCGTTQESSSSNGPTSTSEAGPTNTCPDGICDINETTNGNVSIPSQTENYTDKGPSQIDESTVNSIDATPASSEQTSNITSADKYDNCAFEGFIGDSKNCKKFYRCVANENSGFTKYEFTCGEGTVWDTEVDTCNYPWAVKGSCGYKDVGSEESSTAGAQNGTSVETQTPSTDSGNVESQSEVSTSTGDSSEQSPTSETTTKGSSESGNTQQPNTGESSEQTPTSETTTKGSPSTEQIPTSETTTKESPSTGDSSEQLPTSETTTKGSSSESGNNETTQQPNTGDTSEQSSTSETTTNGSSGESGKNETTTGDTSEQSPVTGSTITVTTIIVDITTASTVETVDSNSETSPTNQNIPTSDKMKCTKEGFFPNLEQCNKFYRCVPNEKGFIKYEFDCGGGTIWDPDLDTCNHPYAVTNKQCEQGSQQQQTKNECTTGGYFADSQDCKKFYRCVDNGKGRYIKYEFKCINDTLWDPNTLSCNYAWATRNTVCGHRGDNVPPTSTPGNETKTEPPPEETSPVTSATTEVTSQETTEGQTIGVTEPSEQTTTTEKLTTSSVEITTLVENKEKETTTPETLTSVDVGITETTSSSSESTDSSSSESTVSSSSESTDLSTSESTDSSSSESTVSSSSESTDSSTSTDVSSPESSTNTDSSSVETSTSTDVSSTEPSTNTDSSTSTDSSSLVTDSSPQTVNETTPCPISQLEGYQIALLCPTGFKRHPKYCNLFYQCTSNPNTFEINVLVISCPGRRIYDDSKIQCLPPDETDQQCNGEIAEMEQLRKFGNVVSPMEMEIQEPLCPNEGNFPLNPMECNKNFIKCEKSNNRSVNGFLYQCPENYSYWPVSKKCEKLSPALPCNGNPEERNLQIPVAIEKDAKIDVRSF